MPPSLCVFEAFSLFLVLIYIIMPDFSQIFCNFGGEFCACCAENFTGVASQ